MYGSFHGTYGTACESGGSMGNPRVWKPQFLEIERFYGRRDNFQRELDYEPSRSKIRPWNFTPKCQQSSTHPDRNQHYVDLPGSISEHDSGTSDIFRPVSIQTGVLVAEPPSLGTPTRHHGIIASWLQLGEAFSFYWGKNLCGNISCFACRCSDLQIKLNHKPCANSGCLTGASKVKITRNK